MKPGSRPSTPTNHMCSPAHTHTLSSGSLCPETRPWFVAKHPTRPAHGPRGSPRGGRGGEDRLSRKSRRGPPSLGHQEESQGARALKAHLGRSPGKHGSPGSEGTQDPADRKCG